MSAELDLIVQSVRRGGKATRKIDARVAFQLAGLPDKSNDSIGFVAQGVTFGSNIDEIDRSMLSESEDPEDYLIPQAPKFFQTIGKERTQAIFEGAIVTNDERILFRAERAFNEWCDGGGQDIRIYRLVDSNGQAIYGAVSSSGSSYGYEAQMGPLFPKLAAADAWARKDSGFFGWFCYGGGALEQMIAAARDPTAFSLTEKS